MTDREDLIQVLYGRAATWARKNIVLKKGEHGFEWDTNQFKIGDGAKSYNDLDYFLPETKVRELIAEAIDNLPVNQGGGVSAAQLDDHINSLNPHPVYDDGPDFLVYYSNAKV